MGFSPTVVYNWCKMEFRDRKNETKELMERLNSKKFEFIIIYGRRRVGKTELVLHVSKHKKTVYYLTVGKNNLERFYNACLEFDGNIKNLRSDFEVLLDYLKDKAEIVIIDEFQNLIKEDKNILNLLQAVIDTKLKNSGLKLILLSSSVSMITSKVLDYQSPLYGRRTSSMKLKPVSFFDLKEFFPDKKTEELVEIYGFSGGIPYYLIRIDAPFWKFLGREIKEGFLKDEIDFLMKYEFEDSNTYKLVLEAIAQGSTKLGEIKNFIKVSRTDLSPYLQNLIEVDLITREVPLTENVKSRNGRYYLKDNFLKFWFKYIYPNLSGIESGAFNSELIKNNFSEYLGGVFEEISKQYLIKTRFFGFISLGKWWFKERGIDILALNESRKEALFGECKWKDKVNPLEVLGALEEKAKFVRWHDAERKEVFAVFAKSFSKKVSEFNGRKVYCIGLKEIERALS